MKMKFLSDTSKIISWIKSVFYAFLIVIFIKGCVGDISHIPSPSMNGTMQEGDFFYVNRLAYGPRLIRTPLSFPFVSGKWYSTLIRLPYVRFFGEPGVERNDVIVFNFPLEDEKPVDHREQYVKRVIGLPGDTLRIVNAVTLINDKPAGDTAFCSYNYLIKIKPLVDDSVLFAKYNLSAESKISDEGHYSFNIPDSLALRMAADTNMLKVTKQLENTRSADETVFPFNLALEWNADQYGPVYIPKRGDTLKIDTSNFDFYERIINVYEERKAEIINGKVVIDGDSSGMYIFKMNYYFVMGDNRHDSRDSRHWGFLPEDHIIGKASFILFSYDKSKSHFRKGRWFKGIN